MVEETNSRKLVYPLVNRSDLRYPEGGESTLMVKVNSKTQDANETLKESHFNLEGLTPSL